MKKREYIAASGDSEYIDIWEIILIKGVSKVGRPFWSPTTIRAA